LEFSGEIDILDQDTLDADTPCGSDLCDNLLDALSDFFTSFNDVLEDTCTKDVTKGRLGTLHKSGTHAANAECRFVGIDDVVVDDRCDVHVDIIFGHAYLSGNFHDGDLDIDLLYFLAQTKCYKGMLLELYGLTLVRPGSTARLYFPNFKMRPV